MPPPRSLYFRVLALALALLAGCPSSPPGEYRHSLYVFGTLVQLTLWGIEPERAQRLGEEVEQELQAMHRRWHAWHPGELTRLNTALARGESPPVAPDLADLIRFSKSAYRSSGGRFNPAAGHLFALWGFQSDTPPEGPPPGRDAIAAVVAEGADMDDVILDGDRVSSANPRVALDFGGIAKGYAAQVILERLRARGVRNAILNAGGGLQVMGRHGERPWRIGIRAPEGSGVLGAVEVGPALEALHTSGNYERYREYDGKRYQHIIDPRTGLPAEHIVSATVIHPDGALADAAATALVIAGPEAWPAVARAMGIDLALLVDERGNVYMTPGMRDRVRFEREPENILIR